MQCIFSIKACVVKVLALLSNFFVYSIHCRYLRFGNTKEILSRPLKCSLIAWSELVTSGTSAITVTHCQAKGRECSPMALI